MYKKLMLMSYGCCAIGRTWVLSNEFPFIHFVKFDVGIGYMRIIETPFKFDWYKYFPKLKDGVRILS